ncbi:MAG TPA: pilus assembly protein TadG-related protein [Beijerinckiaceae bacterium]
MRRGRFSLWRDVRGGVMVVFAFALPALLLSATAAIDVSNWVNQKEALRKAADAAALAATRELGVSAVDDRARISAVARSVVNTQLGLSAGDTTTTVDAAPNTLRTGVTVVVSQPFRASALGQYVTETPIVSRASAARAGNGKICVLVLSLKDANEQEVIKLEKDSQLTGNSCGVFANSTSKEAIASLDQAVLKADLLCSSGGFKLGSAPASRYVGERRTDCPKIENPLKDRPAPVAGPCRNLDSSGVPKKLVIESSQDLLAGTYCEGIEIKNAGTVVTLRPNGTDNVLIVKDGELIVDKAKLTGRGVAIAFTGEKGKFDFKGESVVDLHAPIDGPLAGILFYGSLDAPDWQEYKITSDNARVLVGTIYLPKGYFTVDAKNPVADQSAYTAIIVNKLKLKDAPKLVLNTDYYQSQVPVPAGIGGGIGGAVRLTN